MHKCYFMIFGLLPLHVWGREGQHVFLFQLLRSDNEPFFDSICHTRGEKLVPVLVNICENWMSSISARELSPLVYDSIVLRKEESHCFASFSLMMDKASLLQAFDVLERCRSF